eukprot:TRINITY_DN67334_c6_g3_i2.p1 TRINITY_DN67334_c6_g3~~TRINITY_DN67334_c6_g3_i2.p1  ORF type:complete len:420 (-),score=155.48 TRINITY_DN67334_c6_g3_i2:1003-2235(-)
MPPRAHAPTPSRWVRPSVINADRLPEFSGSVLSPDSASSWREYRKALTPNPASVGGGQHARQQSHPHRRRREEQQRRQVTAARRRNQSVQLQLPLDANASESETREEDEPNYFKMRMQMRAATPPATTLSPRFQHEQERVRSIRLLDGDDDDAAVERLRTLSFDSNNSPRSPHEPKWFMSQPAQLHSDQNEAADDIGEEQESEEAEEEVDAARLEYERRSRLHRQDQLSLMPERKTLVVHSPQVDVADDAEDLVVDWSDDEQVEESERMSATQQSLSSHSGRGRTVRGRTRRPRRRKPPRRKKRTKRRKPKKQQNNKSQFVGADRIVQDMIDDVEGGLSLPDHEFGFARAAPADPVASMPTDKRPSDSVAPVKLVYFNHSNRRAMRGLHLFRPRLISRHNNAWTPQSIIV